MSTVAEIKEAILELPEAERRRVRDWVQEVIVDDQEGYTDEGLPLAETKRKLDEAARGTFRQWSDNDWQRLHEAVR